MTTDTLKPCPFCGQPPKFEQISRGLAEVWCDNDACVTAHIFDKNAEVAIAMWNRRASEHGPRPIPFSERLPENWALIVYWDTRAGKWYQCNYVHNNYVFAVHAGLITHWLPMPDDPTGEPSLGA